MQVDGATAGGGAAEREDGAQARGVGLVEAEIEGQSPLRAAVWRHLEPHALRRLHRRAHTAQRAAVHVRRGYAEHAEAALQCVTAVAKAAHDDGRAAGDGPAARGHGAEDQLVQVQNELKVRQRIEQGAVAIVAARTEGKEQVIGVRVPRELLGRAADDTVVIEHLNCRLHIGNAITADDVGNGSLREPSER